MSFVTFAHTIFSGRPGAAVNLGFGASIILILLRERSRPTRAGRPPLYGSPINTSAA